MLSRLAGAAIASTLTLCLMCTAIPAFAYRVRTPVAFSPDGKVLTSGIGSWIYVWEFPSGRLLHILKEHSDTISALVFAPSGEYLASAAEGSPIIVWNARTGQMQRKIVGPAMGVDHLAIDPTGHFLFAANDGIIQKIHFKTGDLVLNFNFTGSPTRYIEDLAVDLSGRYLYSGGYKSINWWNTSSGTLIRTLRPDANTTFSLAVHPSGSSLISGHSDGRLRIWDLPSGHLNRVIEVTSYRGEWITFIQVSRDGRYIVARHGDVGASITVWEYETGKLVSKIRLRKYEPYPAIAINPSSEFVAALDDSLLVWKIQDGSIYRNLMNATVESAPPPVAVPSREAGGRSTNSQPQVPTESERSPARPGTGLDTAPWLQSALKWTTKFLAVLASMLALIYAVWWTMQRIPQVRPHASRVAISLFVSIGSALVTSVIAFFLWGSPETASVAGVLMMIVAHYLFKDSA